MFSLVSYGRLRFSQCKTIFRVEMYQFKNVVSVNRADLNVGKRF